MKPSLLKIHLALFTVALMFSANYVISKVGMRAFSPLSFAWLRVAGSAIILMLINSRGESYKLERSDNLKILGFTILGVVMNQTLFLAGLHFTTVQVAAILITTIPVFALAAAIGLGLEKASMARTAGIALAAAGALLVLGGEGIGGTRRSLIGAVMIVANCLCYAIYLVVSKQTMTRLSARIVVTRMFAWGAVLMFPISVTSLVREEWASIPTAAWVTLGLVIAGPTVTAYMLNAWALRHSDSSMVAAYTYVQPVLATILGAILLGEIVRPIVLVAGAMIFAGVWLAGQAAQAGPIPD